MEDYEEGHVIRWIDTEIYADVEVSRGLVGVIWMEMDILLKFAAVIDKDVVETGWIPGVTESS